MSLRTAVAGALVALLSLSGAALASTTGNYREFRPDTPTVTPDGDGKYDKSVLSLTAAEFTTEQTLTIEVLDSRGKSLFTIPMNNKGDSSPATYEAVFDGTDGKGNRLPDDTYLLQVRRSNDQIFTSTKIMVDATPPEALSVTINPAPFSTGTRFYARFSEHVNWLLEVRNHEGRSVWSRQGAGTGLEEPWDGTAYDGTAVPDGNYTLAIRMADRGNHQAQAPELPFSRKSQVGFREFKIDRKVVGPTQSATILGIVDEPVTYRFDLVNFEGISVRSVGGGADAATPVKIVLDRRDGTGANLPDGRYPWTLTIEDSFGNRSGTARGDLQIDTKPPGVQVGEMPVVTAKEMLYLPYRTADPNGVAVAVLIVPETGKPHRLTMDATATELALPLAPGTQMVEITATDGAGNESFTSFRVTRVVEPKLQVFVHGRPLLSEVAPEIVAGRTVLPLRAVAEALGFDVQWDAATQTITLGKGDRIVQMTIGSQTARVGSEARTLEVAPFIKADRTMVPVRFVSEGLGLKITWDEETRSVLID